MLIGRAHQYLSIDKARILVSAILRQYPCPHKYTLLTV